MVFRCSKSRGGVFSSRYPTGVILFGCRFSLPNWARPGCDFNIFWEGCHIDRSNPATNLVRLFFRLLANEVSKENEIRNHYMKEKNQCRLCEAKQILIVSFNSVALLKKRFLQTVIASGELSTDSNQATRSRKIPILSQPHTHAVRRDSNRPCSRCLIFYLKLSYRVWIPPQSPYQYCSESAR
jgi:hypothetical protein